MPNKSKTKAAPRPGSSPSRSKSTAPTGDVKQTEVHFQLLHPGSFGEKAAKTFMDSSVQGIRLRKSDHADSVDLMRQFDSSWITGVGFDLSCRVYMVDTLHRMQMRGVQLKQSKLDSTRRIVEDAGGHTFFLDHTSDKGNDAPFTGSVQEVCEVQGIKGLKGLKNVTLTCGTSIARKDPRWFREENVRVHRTAPFACSMPTHAHPVVRHMWLLGGGDGSPISDDKLTKTDLQDMFDDTFNMLGIINSETGKHEMHSCQVKTAVQWRSCTSALVVADYFNNLDATVLYDMFEAGHIKLYVLPCCVAGEKRAQDVEAVRRWWIGGPDSSTVSAYVRLRALLILKKIEMHAGIHGSVFVEGALAGGYGIVADHVCITMHPFSGNMSAGLAEVPMPTLGGIKLGMDGTELLMSVDVCSQDLRCNMSTKGKGVYVTRLDDGALDDALTVRGLERQQRRKVARDVQECKKQATTLDISDQNLLKRYERACAADQDFYNPEAWARKLLKGSVTVAQLKEQIASQPWAVELLCHATEEVLLSDGTTFDEARVFELPNGARVGMQAALVWDAAMRVRIERALQADERKQEVKSAQRAAKNAKRREAEETKRKTRWHTLVNKLLKFHCELETLTKQNRMDSARRAVVRAAATAAAEKTAAAPKPLASPGRSGPSKTIVWADAPLTAKDKAVRAVQRSQGLEEVQAHKRALQAKARQIQVEHEARERKVAISRAIQCGD